MAHFQLFSTDQMANLGFVAMFEGVPEVPGALRGTVCRGTTLPFACSLGSFLEVIHSPIGFKETSFESSPPKPPAERNAHVPVRRLKSCPRSPPRREPE